MSINSGALRHRINILTRSETENKYGELVDEYVPVVSGVPCKIYWESGQITGEGASETKVRLKIQMRKRAIPEGALIEYAGIKYSFVFANEVSRVEQLVYAEAIA